MATTWLDSIDPAKPFFLLLHGYDTHTTYLKPTPYGLLHTGVDGFTRAQEDEINATERVMDGLHHRNLDLLTAVTVSELYPRSAQGKAKLAEMASEGPMPFPNVSPEDQEIIRKVYDGAVSYADAMFGVMLARLEKRGLLNDTLIVLMGDHGEALGEYGLFHRCCSLEDDVTHVPLMVRMPGGEHGGERVDGVVELVDIYPTILERAGAMPPVHMRGQSFGAALRGEPFAGRRAAMTQGGLGSRLLSARSLKGRLTYTGIPLTSPDLASVVVAMRIDATRTGVHIGEAGELLKKVGRSAGGGGDRLGAPERSPRGSPCGRDRPPLEKLGEQSEIKQVLGHEVVRADDSNAPLGGGDGETSPHDDVRLKVDDVRLDLVNDSFAVPNDAPGQGKPQPVVRIPTPRPQAMNGHGGTLVCLGRGDAGTANKARGNHVHVVTAPH
jgi:hypothetical protein